MKNIFLFFTALFLFSSNVNAQIRSFNDCDVIVDPDNLAFKNGESIKLIANYKWGLVNTAVGEANFRLTKENYNNQMHYVASIKAHTYGFFDIFFEVRDSFMAKFNAKSLKPSYFTQQIKEGNYTKSSHMNFDWEKKLITGKKQRRQDAEYDFSLNLQNCMFDLISFVYYLRNIDFESISEGTSFSVSFALDEKVTDINVAYVGATKVKTKAGKFNSYKVAIQTLESETFTTEDKMYIYLSRDKNRLPLYLELPLKIGKVRVSLSDYSNLKHPLSSKN